MSKIEGVNHEVGLERMVSSCRCGGDGLTSPLGIDAPANKTI
jgi:hypothetical protein